MVRWSSGAALAFILAFGGFVTAQSSDAALEAMVDTERAFAKRATVVGWKQSFLEYFADSAIGFDGDRAVPAKDQIRKQPDPPKDLQLLWEPRYGDIAASGELGWLTGPSTTINPARNDGAPRFGNYASVWKRQADGRFEVVLDVGINTPEPAPFAHGFTRAPHDDRDSGAPGPSVGSLAMADQALTKEAMRGQAAAYRQRLAAGVRFHRPNVMPLVGAEAVLRYLQQQPPYAEGTSSHAEAARSGDLGYTWGTYALAKERGFYARVWVRGRDRAWTVVLDVLQPQ